MNLPLDGIFRLGRRGRARASPEDTLLTPDHGVAIDTTRKLVIDRNNARGTVRRLPSLAS